LDSGEFTTPLAIPHGEPQLSRQQQHLTSKAKHRFSAARKCGARLAAEGFEPALRVAKFRQPQARSSRIEICPIERRSQRWARVNPRLPDAAIAHQHCTSSFPEKIDKRPISASGTLRSASM